MNFADEVTSYIRQAPPEQRDVLIHLRDLIHHAIPEVVENIKWGMPVFCRDKKDFAYLKSQKNYITLGFYDYTLLPDPDNRLEGTGEKMRHVKIYGHDDINEELFAEWLKALAC